MITNMTKCRGRNSTGMKNCLVKLDYIEYS